MDIKKMVTGTLHIRWSRSVLFEQLHVNFINVEKHMHWIFYELVCACKYNESVITFLFNQLVVFVLFRTGVPCCKRDTERGKMREQHTE